MANVEPSSSLRIRTQKWPWEVFRGPALHGLMNYLPRRHLVNPRSCRGSSFWWDRRLIAHPGGQTTPLPSTPTTSLSFTIAVSSFSTSAPPSPAHSMLCLQTPAYTRAAGSSVQHLCKGRCIKRSYDTIFSQPVGPKNHSHVCSDRIADSTEKNILNT